MHNRLVVIYFNQIKISNLIKKQFALFEGILLN